MCPWSILNFPSSSQPQRETLNFYNYYHNFHIALLVFVIPSTIIYLSVRQPEVVERLVVAVSEKTAQFAEVESRDFNVTSLKNKHQISQKQFILLQSLLALWSKKSEREKRN